jgi:hypothetical protein
MSNRGAYLSHIDWFISVLQGKNVVLSHTSALEALGLFSGYVNESQIDLYALEREPYDNVNYTIVDDQSLVQGLSDYYHSHGESFDGLEIDPQNMERFKSLEEWAIEYYNYD